MIQLVYTSRADPHFADAQLEDILFVSRRNNTRDQTTGVLLYQTGRVIQVLEGDEEKVRRLFEAIRLDKRHREVALIYIRPLTARDFGDWSMGFRLLDTAFWSMPQGSSDIRRLVTVACKSYKSRLAITLLFGCSSIAWAGGLTTQTVCAW